MGHRPGEPLGVPERAGLLEPLPLVTRGGRAVSAAGLGYNGKNKKKKSSKGKGNNLIVLI